MKYESNWAITKFEVEGKDAIPLIYIFHFEINVNLAKVTPPAVEITPNGNMKVMPCKADFQSKGGKDYIEIFDHYYFAGIYEIRCVDETCCRIVMENERIYLEMDYNGDLPFGKSRDCPEPRTPFEK